MNYLQFTDFRNQSKKYFDKVEKGTSFIIVRKGKPVAKIVPFIESGPGWKRNIKKIKLNSKKSSLDYILEERNEK